VGSADGVWRRHVDQERARLATSYGGDEVTNEAAAQMAWAASDIDAAKLQVTASLDMSEDYPAGRQGYQQAIARARGAADRLLANSRHALDATDPVTRLWRDVHAGCRMAVRFVDAL
jgi:3-hydroxy-9,10-secoandrosta-1,3,5(10)-triene-9,17-dione monooxygenase